MNYEVREECHSKFEDPVPEEKKRKKIYVARARKESNLERKVRASVILLRLTSESTLQSVYLSILFKKSQGYRGYGLR